MLQMTTAEALRARLFRPDRPSLSAARRIVAKIEDAELAWRALCDEGIVPAVLARGLRDFAASDENELAQDTQEVRSGKISSYPPTMDAVLSIASDPAGVLSAEQHLAEFVERLIPWLADRPSRHRWLIAPSSHPHGVTLNGAYVVAVDSLDASLEEDGVDFAELLPPLALGLPHIVRRGIAADAGWRIAVERKLKVSRACWPPTALADKPFSALSNPVEPLLALWMTGYLLDVSSGPEDVWLVAPKIDSK